MAEFYVDHGAYATNIGATPTWGTPQEGDGSATTAAAASAIASILFNAIPTSGAFTICGLSPSTTGVLSAASVDAAANALATNINAVSSTVGSSVAVGTPQLRNLVYARGPSGGAPAGTCEIMMRVGSTTLNHASNSNVAIASTFNGTAPTLTQFIGGTGGCWGWLVNTSAIGVSSSIAALAYGVMVGTSPMVWTATPTADDIIWARSGSGKTISYSNAGSYSLAHNGTWPMYLLVDSNIKWTGDSGNGVVQLDLTMDTNNSGISVPIANAGGNRSAVFAAVKQGGLKYKFITSGTNNNMSLGQGGDTGQAMFINIDYEDASTQTTSRAGFGSGQFGASSFRSMRFTRLLSSTTLPSIASPINYTTTYMRFEGCTFQWNISGVSDPGPVVSLTNQPYAQVSVSFIGCDFSGWASGNNKFTIFNAIGVAGSDYRCTIDNCTGVKLTSTYNGFMTGAGGYDPTMLPTSMLQSGDSSGEFRYEQRNGLTEWDPGASPAFPLLSALLPDASTPWSMKAIWMYTNGPTSAVEFKAGQMRVLNRLSSATRTVTLELFYRSALHSVLNRQQISVLVTYVNHSTGKMVTETLHALPSSSSASWTNAGSWSGYSAYKLELTTANSIRQNTEVAVHLRISGRPATAQNENIFFDPEPGIA